MPSVLSLLAAIAYGRYNSYVCAELVFIIEAPHVTQFTKQCRGQIPANPRNAPEQVVIFLMMFSAIAAQVIGAIEILCVQGS